MKAVIYALLLILLPVMSNAAASLNPTEQMKPFVERVVAQLKDPEFKKDTVDNRIDRIVALVAEQFDFQEMSKRVVGRPWQVLPLNQQQRFASLFAKLLGYVYINKVDTYLDMKIEFGKERVEGDRAEVKTVFVGADKNILVSYRMILRDGKWMAYDVFIENISVVRNNMEQFKGIAQDQLIPVLERKLQELKSGKMEQETK